MDDWSILSRFLSEVQNHSTVIGKIWLTMLLIFRILLVALVGDAVYSDEQSKFTCNTQQPGCSNVCYDIFAPVSHLRFWVFQIVSVSTPSIFYIVFVLHKIAKNEKLDGQRTQVVARGPPRQRCSHMVKDDIEALKISMPTYCSSSNVREIDGVESSQVDYPHGTPVDKSQMLSLTQGQNPLFILSTER